MKTAEEWMFLIGYSVQPEQDIGVTNFPAEKVSVLAARDIQAVQLDAFKAGMTHARRIFMDSFQEALNDGLDHNGAVNEALVEILKSRDTLTALPEVKV